MRSQVDLGQRRWSCWSADRCRESNMVGFKQSLEIDDFFQWFSLKIGSPVTPESRHTPLPVGIILPLTSWFRLQIEGENTQRPMGQRLVFTRNLKTLWVVGICSFFCRTLEFCLSSIGVDHHCCSQETLTPCKCLGHPVSKIITKLFAKIHQTWTSQKRSGLE